MEVWPVRREPLSAMTAAGETDRLAGDGRAESEEGPWALCGEGVFRNSWINKKRFRRTCGREAISLASQMGYSARRASISNELINEEAPN